MNFIRTIAVTVILAASSACVGTKDATPDAGSGPTSYVSAPDPGAKLVLEQLNRSIPSQVSGVVLIAHGETVLAHRAFGSAFHESSRPNTLNTAFDIGSLAKLYTAALILQLVEDGRLRIEDPISHYIDDLPRDIGAITVGQLLSHHSGLPNYFSGGDFAKKTAVQAAGEIRKAELAFAPGHDCAYSNMGYGALALVVEAVTEMSFADALTQYLKNPLDLNKTGFFGDRLWSHSGVAYGSNNGRTRGSIQTWGKPTWALLGGGGMGSTTEDVFHFWRALIDDRIGENVRNNILRVVSPNNCGRFFEWLEFKASHATFGMFVWNDAKGRKWYYKGGASDFGFYSMIAWLPDSDITIIALFNAGIHASFSPDDDDSEKTVGHSTIIRRLLALAPN